MSRIGLIWWRIVQNSMLGDRCWGWRGVVGGLVIYWREGDRIEEVDKRREGMRGGRGAVWCVDMYNI